MKLVYKEKEIIATITINPRYMKYKFQKLYYAVIINKCNKYSSIASKQRIDLVMTDDDYNILSIKREMHENTIYEDKRATKTTNLGID